MRILHIITSLRTGGAEHLLVDLLPRLQAKGVLADVLLFDGTRTPFYEQIERRGITVYALGLDVRSMYNPWLLVGLIKHLKQHAYDIVHTHNTPCQLLAALVSYVCHVRLVTTEHNTFNRRRQWSWFRRIDGWMYSRYRRIICVNEETERKLKEALEGLSLSERIVVVPNGIDLSCFGQDVFCAEDRIRYIGKQVIIMVAAFRKQKDQKTLIRAMQMLSNEYVLLLAGEGECLTECEAMARTLNVKERVVFLGVRSDIPALLSAADVVVMSSHYEGLSLSSIEGMAVGKPFIASDVDGLREIVDGAGLLFPHEDYRSLAELIRKVCEEKDFGRQVAQRCRKRAMQYDISRMTAGYVQVYEHL